MVYKYVEAGLREARDSDVSSDSIENLIYSGRIDASPDGLERGTTNMYRL